MRRALFVAVLALTGCLDFGDAASKCLASGHCLDGGGGSSGGGAAGGSAGGTAGGAAGGSAGGAAGGMAGGSAGGMAGGMAGGSAGGMAGGSGGGADPCPHGTWCTLSSDPGSPMAGYAVWGAGPDDVFVVGGAGAYVRRFVNGVQVDAGRVPNIGALYAVDGRSSSDVWASGYDGGVLHFDGTRWTIEPYVNAEGSRLYGIHVTDREVFAAGANGVVRVRSFDGGWSYLNPPTSATFNAVWTSSDGGEIWAPTQSGYVYHREAGTWTSDQPTGSGPLFAIAGHAVDDIWAVGSGRVLHWSGSSWTAVGALGSGPDFAGVCVIGPMRALACGAVGALESLDGPSRTSIDAGTTANLWGVRAFPVDAGLEVWVVGDDDTVLRYRP